MLMGILIGCRALRAPARLCAVCPSGAGATAVAAAPAVRQVQEPVQIGVTEAETELYSHAISPHKFLEAEPKLNQVEQAPEWHPKADRLRSAVTSILL